MTDVATRTRRRLNYAALAQDLVLFGNEDLEGVMRAHGLDEVDLEALLATSAPLRRKIAQLKKQIEQDPAAIIRMKAASVVEGNLVNMSALIQDHAIEPKDRINAMRLVSELANAMPRDAKTSPNAGVVLQLNLGSLPPPGSPGAAHPSPATFTATLPSGEVVDLPRPVNVIEHIRDDEVGP